MRRCKLGAIADFKTGPFGTQFNPREYTNEGIPMIATESIDNGILDMGSVKYVSPQTRDRLKAHIVEKDDIVFGRAGSVDRHLYIDDKYVGFLQGSNCIRMRKRESINMRYLSYYLQLESVKKQITNHSSGSVQSFLNTDKLGAIEIVLQDDSNKIANLLYSFDKKIALNNRVNATLEAMAKTLYDYWFVQFDFPDEKGRPYKTSGGKMVYNEELGREIPAGWEVVPLTAVCKIVDCLHSQKPNQFYESEKFFLLQLENIVPLGLVDIRNKYYVKSADYELWTSKIEIQEGDLLITNAGRVGAFSRVPKGIRAGIGRNITAIRPQQVSAIYFYYYLHSVDCKRQIRLNTDVGAFFDSLNVKGLKNMYVLLPPKHLMQLFDKQGGHCRERLESAAQESERLVALRDWLLPMLMNGQVGFRRSNE